MYSIGYISMNKYKIQLSMYGLVSERADITIEAENEKEARDKALENIGG